MSFRNTIFAAYKANRKQPPENLEAQFEYCRRITEAIGVTCFEADDYEADDVIGTIAMRMSALDHAVVIVTGDKDMSQLVCDNVRVYDIAREHWLDEAAVREKFGVAPSQIPDLLALHGDSIDNIPGVMGVGEKTAWRFGSAENWRQSGAKRPSKFRPNCCVTAEATGGRWIGSAQNWDLLR